MYSQSPSIPDQFLAAGLDVFHNQWSLVHDFTALGEGDNWSVIAQETTPTISIPTEGKFSGCGLSFEKQLSVVPYTTGTRMRPGKAEVCSCLLILSNFITSSFQNSSVESFGLHFDVSVIKLFNFNKA